MKRLIMMVLLAVMLIVPFCGFMVVERQPLFAVECRLSPSDASLKILPGPLYRQNQVSMRVTVKNQQQLTVAEGFRKVELLQIPSDGVLFRIPLSDRLASGQKYLVSVTVDSPGSEMSQTEFAAIHTTGTSSDDFFARRFKAITEPASMRNQVSAKAIRKVLL